MKDIDTYDSDFEILDEETIKEKTQQKSTSVSFYRKKSDFKKERSLEESKRQNIIK
ncbi:hypothetical protein [Piscirickettsia litoralis]|uniref:hypothetical protein n=1 Tax=Piscirickettsia litoralis TaxID=1891921 RepID=UPI001300EDC6|nr:hypothetical protein [Piscirickettsia litoralis]